MLAVWLFIRVQEGRLFDRLPGRQPLQCVPGCVCCIILDMPAGQLVFVAQILRNCEQSAWRHSCPGGQAGEQVLCWSGTLGDGLFTGVQEGQSLVTGCLDGDPTMFCQDGEC